MTAYATELQNAGLDLFHRFFRIAAVVALLALVALVFRRRVNPSPHSEMGLSERQRED